MTNKKQKQKKQKSQQKTTYEGGEGILNKVHKDSLKDATSKYDKFPNPNFLNNCNIL